MEEAVNFADEHWSIAECLPCTEKPCGPQAILMARMQIRPPLPVVLQSSGRSSGALAASKPALSKPLAASSSAAKPSTSRSRTAKRKADAAEADEGPFGGSIDWKANTQNTVTHSSTERLNCSLSHSLGRGDSLVVSSLRSHRI